MQDSFNNRLIRVGEIIWTFVQSCASSGPSKILDLELAKVVEGREDALDVTNCRSRGGNDYT